LEYFHGLSFDRNGKPVKRLFQSVAFALCVLVLNTQPVCARALSASDQASLDLRRDEFVTNLRSGNFGKVLSIIPPRILIQLARQSGISREELIAAAEQSTRAMSTEVQFIDIQLPVTRTDFKDHTLSNGKPVTWAYANYTGSMMLGAKQQSFVSTVLIIRDAGRWYLIRATSDQLALIQSVYPFISAPPQLPSQSPT
jgi:hypothetical protein